MYNLNNLTEIDIDEIRTKAKAMRELKDNWAFKVFINEIKEIRERAKEELADTKDDHRFIQGACIAYKAVMDMPNRLIDEEVSLNEQIQQEEIEKAKQNKGFIRNISQWINIGNDSVVR